MWVSLNWGPGAVSCVLAACCVLSPGIAGAGGRTPSGSCPCGRRAAVQFDQTALVDQTALAPAVAVGAVSVFIAPLPPISPPPGTLGMTYSRQSWRIPARKHPRIAMLDVRAPVGTTSVRVLTTYEYREEDEIEGFQDAEDPCVWHFETKPLIPGIPHVYEVVADSAGCEEARMVRLIRGRRVTLEY